MAGNIALKRKPKVVSNAASGPIVGTVIAVSAAGELSVDFPSSPHGAIKARFVTSALPLAGGDTVLIAFQDGDVERPLIVGRIADTLLAVEIRNNELPMQVRLDRERMTLEARDEIVLRCGKGSITLLANGKVIIKGTEVISRSSGANKIKGALVNIN